MFKEYCSNLREKDGLSKEDALRKVSVVYKLANEASKGLRIDKEDIRKALEILKGIGLNIDVY